MDITREVPTTASKENTNGPTNASAEPSDAVSAPLGVGIAPHGFGAGDLAVKSEDYGLAIPDAWQNKEALSQLHFSSVAPLDSLVRSNVLPEASHGFGASSEANKTALKDVTVDEKVTSESLESKEIKRPVPRLAIPISDPTFGTRTSSLKLPDVSFSPVSERMTLDPIRTETAIDEGTTTTEPQHHVFSSIEEAEKIVATPEDIAETKACKGDETHSSLIIQGRIKQRSPLRRKATETVCCATERIYRVHFPEDPMSAHENRSEFIPENSAVENTPQIFISMFETGCIEQLSVIATYLVTLYRSMGSRRLRELTMIGCILIAFCVPVSLTKAQSLSSNPPISGDCPPEHHRVTTWTLTWSGWVTKCTPNRHPIVHDNKDTTFFDDLAIRVKEIQRDNDSRGIAVSTGAGLQSIISFLNAKPLSMAVKDVWRQTTEPTSRIEKNIEYLSIAWVNGLLRYISESAEQMVAEVRQQTEDLKNDPETLNRSIVISLQNMDEKIRIFHEMIRLTEDLVRGELQRTTAPEMKVSSVTTCEMSSSAECSRLPRLSLP